jgi:hypothetical protein
VVRKVTEAISSEDDEPDADEPDADDSDGPRNWVNPRPIAPRIPLPGPKLIAPRIPLPNPEPTAPRMPLPDPAVSPAAELWAALDRTPWPFASVKKMDRAAAEAFVEALEPRGRVIEGFLEYAAVLTSRGVTADFDRTIELIAFGRPWVEMACEDPSLVPQIEDYQGVGLGQLLLAKRG